MTASEAAAAGLALKTLVSDAKPAAHRSITTFAALRDDVYSELTNIDKVHIGLTSQELGRNRLVWTAIVV